MINRIFYFAKRQSLSAFRNFSRPSRPDTSSRERWKGGFAGEFLFGALTLSFFAYHFKRTYDSWRAENTHLLNDIPLSVLFLKLLPLKMTSGLWGYLNDITLPSIVREPVYKGYAWMTGANLEEMKHPNLRKYKNLNEFFSRELKANLRPISADADLICPSDGKILGFGQLIINSESLTSPSEGGSPLANIFLNNIKYFRFPISQFLGEYQPEIVNGDKHLIIDYTKNVDRPMLTVLKAAEQQEGGASKVPQKFPPVAAMQEGPSVYDSIKSLISGIKGVFFGITADPTTKTMPTASSRPAGNLVEPSPVPSTVNPEELANYISSSWNRKNYISFLNPVPKTLYYCTIYLAPGDYHRFHSPCEWSMRTIRHIHGEMFPVAPLLLKWINSVYVLNERVPCLGYWKHGRFSMTPVGSTNVGRIKIHGDKGIVNSTPFGAYDVRPWTSHLTIDADISKSFQKGDEVGYFQMGSTIVLIFEAPSNFQFLVKEGQSVQMGQPLGEISKESVNE